MLTQVGEKPTAEKTFWGAQTIEVQKRVSS